MNNFENHLLKYLTQKEIDQLISSFDKPSKHAALLNLNKMDDQKFLSLFPNVIKHPIVPHAYIYDKNEYELGKSIYHELGCFYLQEPSAMVVSYLLNAKEDDFILDLCAAPGGKTIQASLNMNQKGIIIANDISKERCKALQDNVSRLGLKNVVITNNDFSKIYQNYLNTFDKIILDAPCSGSGMFRKDNKMINDWSINKVYSNAITQIQLIDIAYQMLKPGGLLTYSTCSYSYEENEEIVKHLLDNTDAKNLLILPNESYYQSKSKLGIHLFPHLFPGEGHYVCLITKPGTISHTSFTSKNAFNKFMPEELKNYSSYHFGDYLFALPYDFKYKGLNIVQFGINVGEIIKDKIIYSYHLSHALNNYKDSLDLDENEVHQYIRGEQINKTNNFNGNILLTYEKIPLDFGKTNGIVIKNHYPKYLRKISINHWN